MQLELVVDRLRGEGHRVLVVLPRTYMNDSVPNHTKFAGKGGAGGKIYRQVTQQDKALLQKWKENGELYFCLRGSNDDWYVSL